jgi:anti-sigma factor RsiW
VRLRTRKLTCREVVELVTDYLEGTLSRRDRRRFEAHIAGCEHCTEYLAQLRQTIELTGSLREDDLEPAVRDELLDVFAEWRRDRA